MKKILFAALIGVMLITTGCGCEKEKDKNKNPDIIVNTEKDVIKNQEFEGLQMTNTSLIVTKGVTSFSVDVTNNTGSDYSLKEFRVIFKDESGKELANLPGYVGNVILNGETRTISSSVAIDLSKTKSIEYTVKK